MPGERYRRWLRSLLIACMCRQLPCLLTLVFFFNWGEGRGFVKKSTVTLTAIIHLFYTQNMVYFMVEALEKGQAIEWCGCCKSTERNSTVCAWPFYKCIRFLKLPCCIVRACTRTGTHTHTKRGRTAVAKNNAFNGMQTMTCHYNPSVIQKNK